MNIRGIVEEVCGRTHRFGNIHTHMCRLVALALLCCFLSGCDSTPASGTNDIHSIHVLSYNVENAFDDRIDGTEYVDYSSDSNYYDDSLWRVKIDHIRDVLQATGAPQIVGLVEVENERMARMILESVRDLGYIDMSITHGRSTTQCVLLSSFSVVFSSSLPTTAGVRDILSASVDIDGTQVHILVNHWKAKDTGETESLRMQSARVARTEVDRIFKEKPDADILLLGDFNSTEDEHRKTGRTTGINDILRTTGNVALVSGASYMLYDPWFELTPEQRGTTLHDAEWQSLDHIIMSPGLFDRSGMSYDRGSFDAVRIPFLLSFQRAADGRRAPNRWQESECEHGTAGYSDHLPILAQFMLWPLSTTTGP